VTPKIKQFLQTVAQLAGSLGAPVLMVVRDPGTRAVHFVGTPGALDNMRAEIAAKVGVNGEEQPDTGWDG
jgi:hypothetical protein